MESDELQQYYAELACDGGFEARCHMELPERSLVGARIVNVGCRRGKGTYKLSEQVGEGGFVVGVDWNEAFVEAARAGVPRALERSGLSRCNMAFRVGFPEDLAAAGLEEGWADFVYLNSSLSLFASPARALRECGRVLAPGGVLLCVRDTGCGIPKEELCRVTEPFYMVDKSRARAQNGSGLGLALCQRIAAAHHTALEFESEVGRGTTVRLSLQRGTAP